MVKEKITASVEKIITFGLANRLKEMERVHGNYAAAGDPTEKSELRTLIDELIGAKVTINDSPFFFESHLTFEVVGDSMEPKDIHDGDLLLLKEYQIGENPRQNDFLIIKVDDNYYRRYNRKSAVFDTKLRMALLVVTPLMTIDEIIEQLRPCHKEILIKEYQKHLKDKLKKSREFYAGCDLVLSITYHDGFMRYSFHPVSLIVGKVVLIARRKIGSKDIEYITI